MTQPEKQVAERIKNVKSSLDNAEQSFLDNKSIRGELDLMLAEAELKNLRRKRFLPWSWNRHVLAICVALVVVVAGLGGWYMAKDRYSKRNRPAMPIASQSVKSATAEAAKTDADSAKQNVTQSVSQQTDTKSGNNSGEQATATIQNNSQTAATAANETSKTISKEDMHKLVRSARVELSNSH